jgi:ubiquinone/menaquinone biosynthesis C-methylase UbiE
MGFWANRVLPFLVEKACRSSVILEERKRWVPRASGNVLEIGVGSGLNLAFYDPARVHKVTGIDPSAALLARAEPRAAATSVAVELVEGHAENLPFADGAFDTVVITYTLCSVEDPARVLAEVRRVLAPGGRLIVVEHALAPDESTQRWQRRITPVWRKVSGNCHLDRNIGEMLRDAGFAGDDLTTGFTDGASWLSYTIQGSTHPQR